MTKNAFLNTTNHSVAWLYKRYNEDELVLKAPFQRNPVWTIKQSSYLIDTILHGYPIPELYMQEFVDANGSEQHVIVDGQQRVRACLDFIAGKFPLNAEDSPKWADMHFDDLGESDRKKIFNYTFVVRLLPEMEDSELRKIFGRLNKNTVALNPQELRHATYWGEFISSIEKIADDERWSEVGVFTPNDVRRMLDIEYVSELAIGALHGVQNKKSTLDKWYIAYETEFPDSDRVKKLSASVLGEILEILPDITKTRWKKKSDFYTLFLTMSEWPKGIPLSSDERGRVGDSLRTFGAAVDAYLRDPETPSSDRVKAYAQAVERAASDLGNRRARRMALRGELGLESQTTKAPKDQS